MDELKPKPQHTPAKISVRTRSMVLYFIFLTIAISFIGMMLYLQYSNEGTRLRTKASNTRNLEYRTIKAQRGTILSYDGKVLATTIPHFHLFMDFKSKIFVIYIGKINNKLHLLLH